MCKAAITAWCGASLAAALVILLAACGPAGPTATPPPTVPPPPSVTPPPPTAVPTPAPPEVISDVPYVVDGTPAQKADIYRPAGATGPLPAVLAIHGGYGDKREMASLARYLAERGYVVVTINYRDMPRSRYPAGVRDAFCALAWMHTNASAYGLDPARVIALGHSSGGTMAAALGTVNDPARFLEGCPHPWPAGPAVQGVVAFTGIFDYARVANASIVLHDYIVEYLGGELDAVPDTWAEASPVTWIDGSEPPFLLIHGAADTNIDPQNSRDFAAALEQRGVHVQLLLVPNADHSGVTRSEESFQAVETFLNSLWGALTPSD